MEREANQSRRTRALVGVGAGIAIVALLGTGAVVSKYSQSNGTVTEFAAASWGIELNGQELLAETGLVEVGDFTNVAPGETLMTQERFTNTGSLPVEIAFDSSKSAVSGSLVPYITRVYGNGTHDPSAGGAPDWMFPARLAADDPDAQGQHGFHTIPLADFTSAASESVILQPGETFALNYSYTVDADADAAELNGTSASVQSWYKLTQISASDQTGGVRFAPGVDQSLIPLQ